MPRVRSQKIRQALLSVGLPIEDPTELPERFQLYDADGEPLTLSGYPREIRAHVTAIIGPNATETSIFTVYRGWRALKAATNVPARVRVYASAAYREADLDRDLGVNPRGDHGLLFEFVTQEEDLSYTLSPKVDFATDDPASSDYYMAITNLSDAPVAVTTTFNIVRTE